MNITRREKNLKKKLAHHGKSLISVFPEFFASIYKSFIFAGVLSTRISFYGA